jgi:hypothetical protein
MAGTVGAIFNGAFQCGSSVGLATITSIETAVEAAYRGSQEYAGRAVAFDFSLELSLLNSSPYRSCTSAVRITSGNRLEHTAKPMHPAQRSTHSAEKLDNANVIIPEVSKGLTR